MRITIVLVIGIMTAIAGYAQRYTQQIFDRVDHKTVAYANYDTVELQMDIYQSTNDDALERPVILYVHGGGFAGGRRDEPDIVDFCKNMARRGIVAVSMSYTLLMKGKSFSCDRPASEKLATFKQAALEIGMAANYIVEHHDSYRIDPSLIVLAGSSAGAEAVVHAAYWKDTQVHLPKDFRYAGVISMAGALYDIEMITEETAIPTMLFHGTCDELVPYATAPHHYCKEYDPGYLMLHGAASIARRLEELNKGYYLLTGCNDKHIWAGKPYQEYQDDIAEFVWHDVIQKKFRQIHEVTSDNKTCELVEAPNICR